MQNKPEGSTLDARGVLVLDDCLFGTEWHSDRGICEAVLNGRRLGVLLILAFQAVTDMPRSIRSNIDYTIICRETSRTNRRKLYDGFAPMFDTFNDFCQVLDNITDKRRYMVIKHGVDSTQLDDQVFWFKL